MPRKSAEQRSADIIRAGQMPPEPPEDLAEIPQRLWREVVATKPADQWKPGNLELLRSFVVKAAAVRELDAELMTMSAGSPRGLELLRASNQTMLALTTVAVKLRLTIQGEIHILSAQKDEAGLGEDAEDELLGGMSAWQGRKGRRKSTTLN